MFYSRESLSSDRILPHRGLSSGVLLLFLLFCYCYWSFLFFCWCDDLNAFLISSRNSGVGT